MPSAQLDVPRMAAAHQQVFHTAQTHPALAQSALESSGLFIGSIPWQAFFVSFHPSVHPPICKFMHVRQFICMVSRKRGNLAMHCMYNYIYMCVNCICTSFNTPIYIIYEVVIHVIFLQDLCLWGKITSKGRRTACCPAPTAPNQNVQLMGLFLKDSMP